MRRFWLVGIGAVCAAAASVTAVSAREGMEPGGIAANCLFEMRGKTLVDGPCQFYDIGDDGSFHFYPETGYYFAYLFVQEEGVAIGYWSGDPPESHAHDPLGELRREGACWVSDEAKVCAWRR